MSTWIDFKALREQLDFAAVLRHFQVEVKLKGEQHQGFCPLPNHNGKKNSPSFSANMKRKIFQCFGCGAKGNIIDFWALMSGLNPEEGTELHKAAVAMKKQFCPEAGSTPPRKPKTEKKEKPPELALEKEPPVIVNPPLDFELQNLNPNHPYLASRGFSKETIAHFGLGFCGRGYFKDRIVVPLHDGDSRLIGYAGRITDDAKISPDCPKYLFPGTRERGGKFLEFRKGEFLYNGHRLKKPVDDLAVVEGLFSVHWLHQCEIPNAVGLMGWACSERQAELIVSGVKPGGRVWILSDGDDAGARCAVNVFQLVAPHRLVRWVKLGENKQPTDYSKMELAEMLGCDG